MSKKPVVCIVCNSMEYEGVPAYFMKHSYVKVLVELLGCTPLLIPTIGKDFKFDDIADFTDGLFLSGATSNVSPSCYGAERKFDEKLIDTARDETDLPMIRAAIDMDIPLFAICRGFQEINVACGGTLHQFVQELPGKMDHRVNTDLPITKRYQEQRHKICTRKGGLFERLGLPEEFMTNSAHQQGVDKLGKGLFAEGISEDGLIEAFSFPGKKFVLGVQWHPEADFWLNPANKKLLEAFGQEIRKRKNA